MADAGTLGFDLEEHGIAVAIGGDLLDYEAMAGAFALEPEFAAGAAPEGGKTGFDGFVEGFLVHVADHEDATGGKVLDDGGDEAVRLFEIEIHCGTTHGNNRKARRFRGGRPFRFG